MAKDREFRVLLDHVRTFSSISSYGCMPEHLLAAHHQADVEDCLSKGLIERVSKAKAGGRVVEGVVLTELGTQKSGSRTGA